MIIVMIAQFSNRSPRWPFDVTCERVTTSPDLKAIRALFVSTSYPRDATDWRGIFMAHISAALARQPYVTLMQWTPPGNVDPCVEMTTTPTEARWLAALMQRGGISHWLRTNPVSGVAGAAKLVWMLRSAYCRQEGRVDLYHVNWLQCALPLPADGRPALITVLGNDMRLLRLPMMRSALRRVMHQRNVAICPNATWMMAPLREAFGDLAEIAPVSFGIDPRWYAIQRQPVRPQRWLVVTRLTSSKVGPLFEWSEPLFRDNSCRELHLFGPMQEQIEIPGWVHYHGSATPKQLAGDWFPIATGLITLSQHDEGRPQVMLEAMASTLPVVASYMPAHADIVADSATGKLCNSQSEYAAALEHLEAPVLNREYGKAGRERMVREMGTWDDCAARYVNVYRRLMERRPYA